MPDLIICACNASPLSKDLDWVRDKRLLHMVRKLSSKFCGFCEGFGKWEWESERWWAVS